MNCSVRHMDIKQCDKYKMMVFQVDLLKMGKWEVQEWIFCN